MENKIYTDEQINQKQKELQATMILIQQKEIELRKLDLVRASLESNLSLMQYQNIYGVSPIENVKEDSVSKTKKTKSKKSAEPTVEPVVEPIEENVADVIPTPATTPIPNIEVPSIPTPDVTVDTPVSPTPAVEQVSNVEIPSTNVSPIPNIEVPSIPTPDVTVDTPVSPTPAVSIEPTNETLDDETDEIIGSILNEMK